MAGDGSLRSAWRADPGRASPGVPPRRTLPRRPQTSACRQARSSLKAARRRCHVSALFLCAHPDQGGPPVALRSLGPRSQVPSLPLNDASRTAQITCCQPIRQPKDRWAATVHRLRFTGRLRRNPSGAAVHLAAGNTRRNAGVDLGSVSPGDTGGSLARIAPSGILIIPDSSH